VIDQQLEGGLRVRALAGLARAGSPGRRERAVDDALAAAEALDERDERERAYREIAPLLEPHQLARALAAAERIGEPSGMKHLPAMLPYLSPPARDRLLALLVGHARATPFEAWYAIVAELPPGLESPILESLAELADGLGPSEQAYLITHLAGLVTEQQRRPTAERARAAVDRLDSTVRRLELLLQLGDVDGAERGLVDAAPMMQPDELATCVAILGPRLPPAGRERWVGAALATAEDGRYVLERLAPHLGLDEARTYLARLIEPEDEFDSLMLIEAMKRGLPSAPADDNAPTAAALARRMGDLGAGGTAYALLRLGRDDDVTLSGLVEVAPHLCRDDVLDIEERLLSTTVRSLTVVYDGSRSITPEGPSYLGGRLAPALARVGEVRRALTHAAATDAALGRVDAYLGVADSTLDETRSHVLVAAMETAQSLGVHRPEQLRRVGEAVARDPAAAALAWPNAVTWASARPRDEAIEMLAGFAAVAATVGGTDLVDETFDAVERVLQWWP
jgi:hypothetical protein